MEEYTDYKAGFVAVVGRPNVGKSTLINALLGQKVAAVSPRPQTTRRLQLGILTLDSAQIVFTDTPGIHNPKHKLGNYMNEEAVFALEDSDVILFLVDASVSPHDEDKLIVEVLDGLKEDTPIILALNKIDLLDKDSIEKRKNTYGALLPQAQLITISAQELEHLSELLDALLNHLPEHPPFYPPDQITDLYEREIASDLIREACLNLLRDEVPHSVAVRVDDFIERGEEGAYIEATLLVERDSQKGIVIGQGGTMIKEISTAARKEIERMSGRKVFLRLRVKVRKNWRNDDNTLRSFGFRGKGKGL